MPRDPEPVADVEGARCLVMLGDSVTTDHISPAGAIRPDSPAGRYLTEHGVERRRSEEHTSELQSLRHLVCRLLLEKKNRGVLGLGWDCTARVGAGGVRGAARAGVPE